MPKAKQDWFSLKEEIEGLLKFGKTVNALAKKYNVTYVTMYTVLDKLGIRKRKPRRIKTDVGPGPVYTTSELAYRALRNVERS